MTLLILSDLIKNSLLVDLGKRWLPFHPSKKFNQRHTFQKCVSTQGRLGQCPQRVSAMPSRSSTTRKQRLPTDGRKGAKPGNKNSLRHGAFAQLRLKKIDSRTREGKTLLAAQSCLSSAMGGDPSPQQSTLIDRIIFKMLHCLLYERAVLAGNASSGTDHIYLAWANSLRLDLQLTWQRRNRLVLAVQWHP